MGRTRGHRLDLRIYEDTDKQLNELVEKYGLTKTFFVEKAIEQFYFKYIKTEENE